MAELVRVTGKGFRAFEAEELRGFWPRLKGLLLSRSPENARAVILEQCGSIHTFGMAFPIDCCFLNKAQRAVLVQRALPAGRFLSARTATLVIERPAAQGSWIAEGTQVVFERGAK